MAKGFEIAEGYLNIDSDVSGALKDVRKFFKEVETELDAVEKDFKKGGLQAGEEFSDGVVKGGEDGAKRLSRGITQRLRDEKGRFVAVGKESGEEFSKSITESIKRRTKTKGKGLLDDLLPGDIGGGKSFFGGLLSGAGDFFGSITKGISGAFSAGLDQAKTIWKGASDFFGQVSSIAGGLGTVLQVGGIAVLIPVVIGLAGALFQLSAALFALPAAAGVAVATIAPLMIAFKGFGEAVSAGMSGDVAAFNEALKGLAEPAQKVAREFVGLKSSFSAIKKDVQTAFFAPLIGTLKPLAYTLLPVLRGGLSDVADSLGNFAAGFVKLLSAPDIVEDIKNIFESTSRIWDRLGPSLIELFAVMFGIIEKGLPWVEKFFGWMSGGIDKITGWLSKIQSDGTLEGWFSRAWEIGKKLWTVVQEISKFAVTLLDSFGDEGTDTLKGMGEELKKINEYLKTKDGQEALHNLGVLIHWAGNIVNASIGSFVALMFVMNKVFAFFRGIGPFFASLGHWFADAGRAIGDWFSSAASAVWGWIKGAGKAIADFFVGIGRWFADGWGKVKEWGGKILDWFASLPGKIGAWLAALPGVIKSALESLVSTFLYNIGYLAGLFWKFWTVDLPTSVQNGWAAIKTFVSEGIQKIVDWNAALPGRIWEALQSLGATLAGIAMAAWDWAWKVTVEGIQKTVDWVTALPGRIWEALKSLGSLIGGLISDAWHKVQDNTTSGIEGFMKLVRSVPGKVLEGLNGARKWLADVGHDMLAGLVDGLENALDWAVQQAKRIATRIKDGFLDALDVNSPSKVMAREVGVPIMQGIGKGMDDGMPDVQRYIGAASRSIVEGFKPTVNVAAPNVSVGGTTLIADLGDGIRQAVPLQIMRNPTTVAAATDEGRRQRNWVFSPRAKR